MLGLCIGVQYTGRFLSFLNPITKSYKARVLSDGGTVESLSCVNEITNTFN